MHIASRANNPWTESPFSVRQPNIGRTSFAVALLLAVMPTRAAEPYDIVLRGGRIVDGTGNPWFYGDLAIRGDRIVAMGNLPDAPAQREIGAASSADTGRQPQKKSKDS